MRKHEEKVNESFASNLCQIVHDDIREGKRQIAELNRVLGQHSFNEDSYAFKAYPIPSMSRYAKFFELVAKMDRLGEEANLSDSGVLDEKSQAIYQELLDLLINQNEHESQLQLAKLVDYRNYHQYDVEVSRGENNVYLLGQNATGSGGQSETPFYALRSAALSSAYRLNDSSSHHFKVMVVDEAFEKVDHSRAAEALALLSKTMGFQVIFAMPTKNSGTFHPLISHKFVFSKTPSSVPIGELSHRTLVKSEVIDKKAVDELWSNYIEQVKQQATISFDSVDAENSFS